LVFLPGCAESAVLLFSRSRKIMMKREKNVFGGTIIN